MASQQNTVSENGHIYINEQYSGLELIKNRTCRSIARDGRIQEQAEPVLAEHLMDIYINERLAMKLVCIPQYLAELVLGRLFTEGIIRESREVKSIYICEYGKHARVYLKDQAFSKSQDFVEVTPTCCTGNHILNGGFLRHKEMRPVRPIPWEASWVFALADRFADGMPLHGQTWCTHSCFLAQEDRFLFQCEDIGRHNAMDKAIGYALHQGIDLGKCILYSSGRIPADMAEKAIRAGIPLLASKASPTDEAIQLAQKYRLTLVCAARRDRMKLYAGEMPVSVS